MVAAGCTQNFAAGENRKQLREMWIRGVGAVGGGVQERARLCEISVTCSNLEALPMQKLLMYALATAVRHARGRRKDRGKGFRV